VEPARVVIVPYGPGSDGKLRPYLWLTLTGPRDGQEIAIQGLVDTGADRSVFPIEYVEELGYKVDDLVPVELGQVEGSLSAWEAQKPCEAFVRGLESIKFEIQPLFAGNLDALWGRADLMMTYTVSVSERAQELSLHLP
jgi:hypothetical protein